MGRSSTLLIFTFALVRGPAACGAESESPCATGDISFRDEADHCETCECVDGAWSCEAWECVQPKCPPVNGDCPGQTSWARDPETGACCRYENACAGPEGWGVYGTNQAACEAAVPQYCEPGARVPAGDGCNECACNEDGTMWSCSDEPCSSLTPPPGKACGYWEGGCAAGEYCAFDPVEACSSFDAPSVCRVR